MNLETGTTIKETKYPKWATVDPYGSLLDFFQSRSEARDFLSAGRAWGYKGERLAKIKNLTVEVTK